MKLAIAISCTRRRGVSESRVAEASGLTFAGIGAGHLLVVPSTERANAFWDGSVVMRIPARDCFAVVVPRSTHTSHGSVGSATRISAGSMCTQAYRRSPPDQPHSRQEMT